MLSLKENGHEVVVVAPEDVHSEVLRSHFSFRRLGSLSRKGLNPFRDAKLVYELWRIYQTVKPDLIIHFTIKPNVYGSIAAKFAGIPSLSVVAGLGYAFTHRGLVQEIAKFLYRTCYFFSKKVIFLNKDDVEDFMRHEIIDRDAVKALVFPGEGVNTRYFSPIPFTSTSTDKMNFLFVGRLLLDKGIREFCQAAELVKRGGSEANFQILGPFDDGNPMAMTPDDLREFTKDGYVEYLGEATDVRPFLMKCSALVFPTKYGEGLSRVVLEAMAMGKPTIASNNRGCRPLVEDNVTGFLLTRSDAAELAERIREFIELTEEKRQLLGKNARERVVQSFSSEVVIKHYNEVFSAIPELRKQVSGNAAN